MRVPRSANPRIQNQILKRFGKYEKVYPVNTTPIRKVPDAIIKPNYISPNNNICTNVPTLSEVKTVEQIQGMRTSCQLAANILRELGVFIKPGKTTEAIDELAHNLTIKAGAYPSPLLYNGFPKSVCTSVNNVIVHGIPDLRMLQDGDIVNVDITVFYKGFHGDCSKTFLVGDVDDRGIQLVGVTEEALDIGIKTCGPGVPFSEIGARIRRHVNKNGLTVIPAVLGHGIGQYFHGPPEIYHTRNNYPGVMQPGMTFTIEPAITHGSEHAVLLDDGWTLITKDGARSAQVEHTVLITDDGAEALTK